MIDAIRRDYLIAKALTYLQISLWSDRYERQSQFSVVEAQYLSLPLDFQERVITAPSLLRCSCFPSPR